ncbi:PIG-L family deacetylase [Aldersonia sp. NBC_00410]|uniref:PIG-L deacetylase family protein n=1 Tax=Aldersonia sp. NBC_00410 TaxID=2975954 RepID=UPI002254D868|nr:PIG-L family deacetylase [Aldersonia sp. NBC_00410]MCX5042830.1 PIG-L family deacetylase [Aldersonia sp. NBC_00410]
MAIEGVQRLLVVVAHPDDETFGCGSLLLHARAAGATTAVLCATRGEAGQPAPGSGIDAADLGRIREAELRTAAGMLGVSEVHLLDYLDSGMDGDADVATLEGAPFDDVCRQVRAHIETFRPTVVVTLDAGDGHRDHLKMRDATVVAVRDAQWRVDRVYLQCLPKSLMQRWLDYVGQHNPDSAQSYIEAPGTPDELITTVVDTTTHLAARESAIAAHASQVSPFDQLPADMRREFLIADRMQRVVPPWTGGQRETDIFTPRAVRPV